MQQTVPVHGNPENKVFGLKGSIVGTNLGKLFVKQDKNTLNVGWGELTSIVTTTESPITTTTTSGATTTTTSGATTTTTSGATTTTTSGATTTTTEGETTTTSEDPNATTTTTTTIEGPYIELGINTGPFDNPVRFDVVSTAYLNGYGFVSHEIFMRTSYDEVFTDEYQLIGSNTGVQSSFIGGGSDSLSVANAQNQSPIFVLPYYVQAKSVLTTNGGTFVTEVAVRKDYGTYLGYSSPLIEEVESFP